MRIISQDGKTDLPYDSVALFVNDNVIMAESLGTGKLYAMAEYSSEEKALSAFLVLRKSYAMLEECLHNGTIVVKKDKKDTYYFRFGYEEIIKE